MTILLILLMAEQLSSISFKTVSKNLQNYRCVCDDVLIDKIESKESESESDVSDEFHEEKKSLWKTILQESEQRDAPYIAWLKEREKIEVDDIDSSARYLDKKIFTILLPGLEKMLRKARQWDALAIQKCQFDGLDYLAEYLWNKNPRWPRRSLRWMEAFEIPQFKLCLRLNPRPIFPKSWLWSAEEAALYIQRWVRGWLVRKREDVQELRQFWKALAADKETFGEEPPKFSRDSRVLDICERYKLQAAKRENPF